MDHFFRRLPGMEPRHAPGIAAAACSALLVGAAVAGSGVLTGYPVLAAQALRYGLAAVVLLVVARVLHRPLHRPTWRELGYLVALAATGLAGFNVFLVGALRHAEPAIPGLAVGAVPVVTAIIAPLLARQAPQAHRLAGAAIVVFGAVLVLGTGHTDAVGILWSLGALACEAAFTLLALPVLPRLGAWGVSVWTCALAAPALGVLAVASGGAHAFPAMSASQAAMLVFLAVGATTIGFVTWYVAVARIGAERSSLIGGAVPVATLVFGVVLGTGGISLAAVAGAAIVTIGVLIGLAPSPQHARRALVWAQVTLTCRS
jgi:drug/metabolite transporter (DMT)-like permease